MYLINPRINSCLINFEIYDQRAKIRKSKSLINNDEKKRNYNLISFYYYFFCFKINFR